MTLSAMIEHKFRTANVIRFHSFVDAIFETLYKYAFVGIPIEVNKLVKGHGGDEKGLQGKRIKGSKHKGVKGKN